MVHVEPRGVERLQNVVARGGEEARLGDVGLFGSRLGAASSSLSAGQLLGALAHAALQRLIGGFQRLSAA